MEQVKDKGYVIKPAITMGVQYLRVPGKGIKYVPTSNPTIGARELASHTNSYHSLFEGCS